MARNPQSPDNMVHDGDLHGSRELDAVEYQAVHDTDDDFSMFDSMLLNDPPPRDGMVQKWIRYGRDPSDSANQKNVFSQTRLGWTPRPLETIPKEYLIFNAGAAPYLQIGTSVLCEMPVERKRKIDAAIRQESDKQLETINAKVFRRGIKGNQQDGFYGFDPQQTAIKRGTSVVR